MSYHCTRTAEATNFAITHFQPACVDLPGSSDPPPSSPDDLVMFGCNTTPSSVIAFAPISIDEKKCKCAAANQTVKIVTALKGKFSVCKLVL